MSPGPVPVPPVVMIRSARSVWSSSRPRSPSGSSSQMPTRYACAPASAAAAVSAWELTSTTWPGWLARPTSTSSSPVATITTRGLGRTDDVADAGGGEDRDQRRGDVRARRGRGPRRPASSSPARRSPWPRLGAWQISTAAMPWSVQSGGTTTSAAAGSGAPAATEKQVPGVSRTGRQLDAPRSPTTFSRTGAARCAAPKVLGAGGVAVDARRGRRRGTGPGATHVLGEHVAVRLGEVEVERGQRAEPAQHAGQVVGERRQLAAVRGQRRCAASRVNPSLVRRSSPAQLLLHELGQPLAERRAEVGALARRAGPRPAGSPAACRCRSGCRGRRCRAPECPRRAAAPSRRSAGSRRRRPGRCAGSRRRSPAGSTYRPTTARLLGASSGWRLLHQAGDLEHLAGRRRLDSARSARPSTEAMP